MMSTMKTFNFLVLIRVQFYQLQYYFNKLHFSYYTKVKIDMSVVGVSGPIIANHPKSTDVLITNMIL